MTLSYHAQYHYSNAVTCTELAVLTVSHPAQRPFVTWPLARQPLMHHP